MPVFEPTVIYTIKGVFFIWSAWNIKGCHLNKLNLSAAMDMLSLLWTAPTDMAKTKVNYANINRTS